MITKKLPETQEGIEEAALILRRGGIVAIPTETVYGLAASAYDEAAIKSVFSAKGRPQDNPLIVHISDMEMLLEVAAEIPKKAAELAEKFWPGALTLVLPRSEKIPPSVCAGLSTVAVRMPSHPVAHNIIKAAALPLAAPSANVSGSPSPTAAAHVISDLDGKIDAVVLSGNCEVGVESTVVTLCTNPPRLLRPGGVTAEQLKEVLPDLVIDPAVLAEPEEGKPVASPGMKYKHYSPDVEVIMVEGESFADFVNGKENCGALCFFEEAGKIKCPKIAYGSRSMPITLAEGLFSALRNADSLGVSKIYAHAPEKQGVGLAVYNRLIRAAGFNVIKIGSKIIGLTGPTGVGKTTLCNAASELGIDVINCDKVARETTKDPALLEALAGEFGADVVKNGELDRKLLASRAFSSSEKTERLNQIVLPAVVARIKSLINGKTVILDAPTLYESGLDEICDTVIAVLSTQEKQKERIIARDNLSEAEAQTRLSAQKDNAFFLSRANHAIYNNQTEQEFETEAIKLLKRITEEN